MPRDTAMHGLVGRRGVHGHGIAGCAITRRRLHLEAGCPHFGESHERGGTRQVEGETHDTCAAEHTVGAGRGARAVVTARMYGNGGGGGQRRRLRGAPYPCGNGRGVPARRSHHRLPRSQSRTGSHPGNWARLPWYPIRWRREDRRTCGAHAVRPSCLRPGAYRRPGIRARAMATKSGRVPSHGRTRRPTHGHAWRAGLVRRQPALSVARRWRVGCGTPAGCCGRAG